MGHLVDKELRLAPRVFLFGGDRGGRRGAPSCWAAGPGPPASYSIFFIQSFYNYFGYKKKYVTLLTRNLGLLCASFCLEESERGGGGPVLLGSRARPTSFEGTLRRLRTGTRTAGFGSYLEGKNVKIMLLKFCHMKLLNFVIMFCLNSYKNLALARI